LEAQYVGDKKCWTTPSLTRKLINGGVVLQVKNKKNNNKDDNLKTRII
jgi:hypothetical protein